VRPSEFSRLFLIVSLAVAAVDPARAQVPAAASSPSPPAAPSSSPTSLPFPSPPPAGVVPAALTLTVTGDPADSDFLQARIRDALDRAIRPTLPATAVVRYGRIAPVPQALAPGFETTVTVPVSITAAAEAPAVNGETVVTVRNLVASPFDASLLFFDDDPEYVRDDGVLFRGTIEAARPTRLYYYHENVGGPRRFVVILSPAGGQPARVQVTESSAGPDPDVMAVGHAASRTFLSIKPPNEGVVVDLSSGEPYVLRDLPAGDGQVLASAIDFRVLMGGAVTVTVMAIPLNADPATFLATPNLPGDGHDRHGTFVLDGVGLSALTYTVGGPDAALRYGDRDHSPPNADPHEGGRDVGDYGVLHRITIALNNPSDLPATVYLYERPLGGGVRSSFVVDGALEELGCVRVPNRYQVGAYQLAARSQTAVRILTMTDGGSSYPIEVGVTATPPLPTTPPIADADGCFPKPEETSPPSAAPSATATP
jgi:hypothetical protein